MLVQQYLFEGIFASLLGFVLLYGLRWKKKAGKRAADKAEIRSDGRISSGGGGCRSDGGGSATDVIVVGAGVAGSALAYTLGKDGRRVHVIERDLTEPDRIVGELLQPGGYLKLVELGLQECVEEIDAQRVLGYALFKDGKSSKVSYPLDKFQSDVAGRTFHNGRFIQRMREKAASLPNITLEQGNVTSLLEENGTIKGVKYKTKTGEELQAYAPLTVVCDGCFSNLRRSLCSPKVDVPSCFVGVVLENCQLPYPNHGHVILADPSPILFYPISSTEIRCLVDVPGQKVPSIANGEMANYLKTVVAPQIPEQLHDAFISAIDRGSMRTMPNKSMPASPYPTPGALLMGDAFNMRHPLTGGGMTVALSDIVVLHNLLKPLRDLHDASLLCKYLESFYTLRKAFWDLLQADLFSFFNEFYERGRLSSHIGATFISLIPKCPGTSNFREFRPISLIGSLYKILAKVLSNRLKKVIGSIISPNQCAFVPGRQIIDAALLANESLHSCHLSKIKFIFCNLDMEKAYDHVDWNFLRYMMSRMGFGDRWIRWIDECVSSASFSVLLNGSPKGFFKSSRGIRQGDPLSPFLFLIIGEALSAMLLKAQTEGLFTGIHFKNVDEPLSHVQYADDILIFSDASLQSVENLRTVIRCFEAVAGLKVNLFKSKLYGINLEDSEISELAELMGCSVGSLPSVFVGLPLCMGQPTALHWEKVVNKLRQRLAGWKRRFLSIGGRLTLIKAALSNLPIYFMSLFRCPSGILKSIDMLRRNFLWSGEEEKKKFSLMKWGKVCRHVKEGGAGIKDLRLMNRALLGKWYWRLGYEYYN